MKYRLAVAFLLALTAAHAQPTADPNISKATAPHVVFLGDSITALWIGPASTPNAEALVGFPTWTKILTGYRINSQVATDNFAVGGFTSANVLATVPAALAQKPDVCVVAVGKNDAFFSLAIGNESKVGSVIYNINRIYDQLHAGGCIIIAIKNISHAFAVWHSLADLQKALQINQWIEQQKLTRKGFYVVDAGNTFDDQTSIVHWIPKPHYLTPQNNLHPAQWGAYVLGKTVADQINVLYPDWRLRIQNVEDVYDATNNPTGNLLTSQMFTGTTGTASGGATGTVATSWVLSAANSGGATVVGSKTTTADGRPAQTVTVSGTANVGFIDLTTSIVTSKILQGDNIECSVDANWGATTNIGAVAPILTSVEAGVNFFPMLISGALTSDSGEALPTETGGGGGPAASLSIPLYTPEHVVTAPPTTAAFTIRITTALGLAASPVAGTFQFASPSCRKLVAATVPGQ